MIAFCDVNKIEHDDWIAVKVRYCVDGLCLTANFKIRLLAKVFVKDLNETEKNIMHEVKEYCRDSYPCIDRICYKVNVWVEMPKPLLSKPVNVRTG